MKNLTINYKVYDGTSYRMGYRAMNALLDGEPILSKLNNPRVVTFIEDAIAETIDRSINKEQSIEINVTLPHEIKLQPEIIAHIVAKFEADPIVQSISFINGGDTI